MSASEACWRIFSFDTNEQSPHTVRLPVHLESEQNVFFNDDDKSENILGKNIETQLTSYFYLNINDPDARELYYYQMPQFYIWNSANKQWQKRKKLVKIYSIVSIK